MYCGYGQVGGLRMDNHPATGPIMFREHHDKLFRLGIVIGRIYCISSIYIPTRNKGVVIRVKETLKQIYMIANIIEFLLIVQCLKYE